MTGIAFVFPGQGSQHPGMGRELARAFPESRGVFDEADDALRLPISRICFEGSETELALTENTQPAVLTVCVAALRALEARGIAAAAAAGHSLGEYAAHVAAGTLAFADAVRVVRARGRFMQEAVPLGQGSMAAVMGLDAVTVDGVCRDVARGQVVSAANLNGPDQIVLAGHAAAVARAIDAARAAGARRAVPLAVSAPFHCVLMEPAAARLERELATVRFEDPRFPVFSNVDARSMRSAAEARSALVRQVASPVRWHALVDAMADSGISTFVELGPGKVLSGLIRRIRTEARVLSAGDPAAIEATVRALEAAA